MSDSKTKYSSGVAAQKALAQLDEELRRKLDRAAGRAAQYHQNWQTINLNDFVDKFAPGSGAQIDGAKIVFHTPGSDIKVVCDIRGGYCRLQDTTIRSKRCYLDINGNVLGNKTLPNGKQTGRSQSEYNMMTHFRILKREEM
ncbi:MAG: hypothetical protein K5660_05940 [Paludibacteraceae bacterium]|nr:hypothetical protein [Paludibacteraceae bacterium]